MAATLARRDGGEVNFRTGLAMSSSSAPLHAAVPPVALTRLARLRRGLTAAALLAAGGLAWWWLTTHHFTGVDEHAGEPRQAAVSTAGAVSDAIVTLPPGTAGAADIALAPVEIKKIREHLTVPGRLDYDARYRLDYASPVDGIVARVFVQVREKVRKGDSLAEVSSPAVGLAATRCGSARPTARSRRKRPIGR